MKKILILVLILISANLFAQEKEKTNPIIFSEITAGTGVKNTGSGIFSIHFQLKKNLFTYRFSRLRNVKSFSLVSLFPFIPAYYTPLINIKAKEYAFLYGKRIINKETSYSFSGGFSYTNFTDTPKINPVFENSYIGFPFEINVKWFKSKKERIKIFELIPIGKPTGFSPSMGIKLFGNISKKSYVGIGLTFGYGYYKNYN